MIGILRPAALHEWALVGLVALTADCDIRQGAAQHLELRIQLPTDFADQWLHGLGHVGLLEEVRQVGEVAFLIEVHDVHTVDPDATLLENVDLHRCVG